jgi:dihydroneopterin aldolase
MPIGFCCEKCVLYDAAHTCLKNKTKRSERDRIEESAEERMELLSTSIESGLLKVKIKKKGEEIPIYIDLQKHLE